MHEQIAELDSKIGFNSSLVRLKDLSGANLAGLDMSFQFQSGAIKRLNDALDLHREHRGFNSSLVRLKGFKTWDLNAPGNGVSIPVWCD